MPLSTEEGSTTNSRRLSLSAPSTVIAREEARTIRRASRSRSPSPAHNLAGHSSASGPERSTPPATPAEPPSPRRTWSWSQLWQRVVEITRGARRNQSASKRIDALEDVARLLTQPGNRGRVLVLAGAGISTAAGIPDFRSPGTGLYANFRRYGVASPMALFDIEHFRRHPAPFFQLMHDMLAETGGVLRPTPAHLFVRLLYEKGLLLRCYTQNVDGLERMAGVPDKLLVEAHGSFHRAHCAERRCRAPYDAARLLQAVQVGGAMQSPPRCERCGRGLVKPAIVFFGEPLPHRFRETLREDVRAASLCIVMGTSLTVAPVMYIPDMVRRDVPRVLLNRTPAGRIGARRRDGVLLADVQHSVQRLAELCGWEADLGKLERRHGAGRSVLPDGGAVYGEAR